MQHIKSTIKNTKTHGSSIMACAGMASNDIDSQSFIIVTTDRHSLIHFEVVQGIFDRHLQSMD